MAEIICTGTALVDCIFSGGDAGTGYVESIALYPGGDAFNEAVNIARLGGDCALYCGLGADFAGEMLSETAAKAGLDLSLAEVSTKAATPVSGLFVDARGERRSCVSAAHKIPYFQPDPSRTAGAKIVTMASLFRPPFRDPAFAAAFARGVKERGALLYVDVKMPKNEQLRLSDFADTLAMADFISPNETEAAYYSGEKEPMAQARTFLRLGVKTVLLKLGGDGCLVVREDECFHVPAYDVPVADGVGAGDAFAAGLLMALAERKELREACEWATAAAALCVQTHGAVGGIQNRGQLESFMKNPPKRREMLNFCATDLQV